MTVENNTVLIMDDNLQNIISLSTILKDERYNVQIAKNGSQAIDCVKKDPPQLIIMDVYMSVLDDFNACHEIKKYEEFKLIPIIFISAMDDSYNKVQAFKAGGVDYITTPFQIEELLMRVTTQISLYNLQLKLKDTNLKLVKNLKNTFEQSVVGIFYGSPEGKFIKANKRFLDITGNTERELLEMYIIDIIHEDFKSIEMSNINKLLNKEVSKYVQEFIINHKSGNTIWTKITISLVSDNLDEPDYIVGVLEDITARKESERILKTSERTLVQAQKMAKLGNWELDLVNNKLYWSEEIFDIFGVDSKNFEATYETFIEIIHPDDRDKVNQVYQEHLSNKKPYDIEHRIQLKDGTIKFVRENCDSDFNLDGEPIKSRGTVQDITEKKTVEDEIHKLNLELEDRVKQRTNEIKILSQAVEQSSSSVVITDKNGIIIYVNKNFTDVTGYTSHESIGSKPSIIKSGEMNGSFYKKLWKTILSGNTWKDEILNKKKNNDLFWEFVSISPILNETNDIISFVAVKEDITERKIREKSLREKTFRLALHTDVLLDLTKGHEITDKSIEKAYKVITEASAKGLNIERSSIWLFDVKRESLECLDLYESSLNCHSKGLILTKYNYPAYFKILEEKRLILVNDTRIENKTSELKKKYLDPLSIFSKMDSPIWLRGEVIGIVCNEHIGDIRTWKSDEKSFSRSIADYVSLSIEASDRRQAQDIAETATKSKSDFLANMSHEIRTPMNAVIGLTHLLSKTDLNYKQNDYVKKIDSSGRSLLGIINDILDFSKIEAGKLDIVDIDFSLNDLLDSIMNIVNIKAQHKGLKLEVSIDNGIPDNLVGDSMRISQILINLINNAVKFTKSGNIIISCNIVELLEDNIILSFTVSDPGIGMTDEHKKNLFHSFSQADTSITRKYGGTGLGLAISKKLTEMMGGRIYFESEYHKGSKFSFTVNCKKNKKIKQDIIKFDLKVLVVDDSKIIQSILETYLVKLGCNITLLDSGEDAIDLVKKSENNPFNLILMDYHMPGINGLKAIEEIKKTINIKKTKIILITGFDDEDIKKEAELLECNDFIIKPITKSMLFDSIVNLFGPPLGRYLVQKSSSELYKEKIHSKILLVEDNDINQLVAKEILEDKGLDVDIAQNGKIAVDMVNQNYYDLVFMDIQMPVMDGFTATNIIRRDETKSFLPIIAMTADAMTGVKEEVLNNGMDDYITKPIDPALLFITLEKWLKINIDDRDLSSNNIESILPVIEYISVKKGISRVKGNTDVFIKLIKKFRIKYIDVMDIIKPLYNKKEYEKCEKLIHGIKGAAGNLSAESLYEAATKFDTALTKWDKNSIPIYFTEFEDELLKVLESIDRYECLNKEETDYVTHDESIDIDKELIEFHKLFLELAKNLKEYNMKATDIMDEILLKLRSVEIKDQIKTISIKVEDYEFDVALELLSKFNIKYDLNID
ncbi:MAG: response regulator [Spirochaetaceae bacterium]